MNQYRSNDIHRSFLQTAFLFAVNHGATLSCLGLANSRLGNTVGSYSSSTMYFFYTGFALLGAPLVVKEFGSRKALILGMTMSSLYVASFWAVVDFCYSKDDNTENINDDDGFAMLYSVEQNSTCSEVIATMGGVLGGIGSAILWTSQGSYFSQICTQYARELHNDQIPVEKVTGRLGGEWAFVFLFIEVWMRLLSSLLVHLFESGRRKNEASDESTNESDNMEWKGVFVVYTLLAVGAVFFMNWVEVYTDNNDSAENSLNIRYDGISLASDDYSVQATQQLNESHRGEELNTTESSLLVHEPNVPCSRCNIICQVNRASWKSLLRKAVAAIDLLIHDPKMKWLSFVNITFGLCTSFAMSVVNGEVVRVALNDENSSYVGMFTAVSSLVAAALSWIFGKLEWISPSVVSNNDDSGTQSSRWATVFEKIYVSFEKETVLAVGVTSYFIIALLFILFPIFSSWSLLSLLVIYVLLGIGRSTYEGTLRGIYADYFVDETEGAYANIILFNGLASMVGYWSNVVSSNCIDGALPGNDPTKHESKSGDPYCVDFRDGTTHNVFVVECIIIVSAVMAVAGVHRAKIIHSAINQRRVL